MLWEGIELWIIQEAETAPGRIGRLLRAHPQLRAKHFDGGIWRKERTRDGLRSRHRKYLSTFLSVSHIIEGAESMSKSC